MDNRAVDVVFSLIRLRAFIGAVAAVTLIEAFSRACLHQAMQTFWSLTVIASLFAIVFILSRE